MSKSLSTGRSCHARSRLLSRIGILAAAITLCAASIAPVPAFAAAQFNPLLIISDENWRAGYSLSRVEIQAFLETQAGVLKTYSCAEGGPNGLHSKVVKPASQIIAEAAEYWNVNPKLIIATLQKEQSLITQPYHEVSATDKYGTVYHLTNAMGCGVYAGSPDRHPGFGDQVWTGTEKLGKANQTTGPYAWYPGKTKTVYSYEHKANIVIKPLNQPTWNLYTYTPYYPQYSVWYWYVMFFEDPLSSPLVSIAGADRVGTAIEASKMAFPAGAGTVVIATANNWPDALGGSALAGALRAPILLTAPTSLSRGVATEIARLHATKAIILGGTPAVSRAVADALGELPGVVSVERIGGANRYETANMVARRAIETRKASPGGYDGTAFVATGADFPDALAASPLSAAKGWPIYLSNPAAVESKYLISTMKANGVTKAIVLGGTNVVSSSVATELTKAFGPAPLRLYGATRYATAVAVAKHGVSTAGLTWDKLALATGQNFPDGLAGGVLQGMSGSIVLLTPTAALDPGVMATLTANKASVTEARCLGGPWAVSWMVRSAAANALK